MNNIKKEVIKMNNKVEVIYTVPVERKIMIPENAIKDWEDEDLIKEWIENNWDSENTDDIQIISIN